MGKYILETGGLFLMSLVFLLALSLFISLFMREGMMVFILTLVLSVAGYFLASVEKLSSLVHFLPFTYLNIGKIANGELAIVLDNEGINLGMGLIILLSATVILILLGWAYSRSRWMKVE